MKTACPRRMVLVASVLVASVPSSAAWAALPDPTRPPPGMTLSTGTGTGVVMGLTSPPLPTPPRALAPTLPASAPRAVVVTPRVQSLHHPIDAPPGSASALIDGRLLRVGDRLGDAAVQEIRPDGVWLRLPRGGMQWLGLFAPVDPPAPPVPANATAPESATGTPPARKEP